MQQSLDNPPYQYFSTPSIIDVISVYIIHRPYFQHPVTQMFWTQDQAYLCRTFPHHFSLQYDSTVIITIKNFLLEQKCVIPIPRDIQHASLRPHHKVIPFQSSTSSTTKGLIFKENQLDYTSILF